MNIVFSVDNNFVQQLSVTIASILLNSKKDDKFMFYVLDGGIFDINKKEIEKLNSIKTFNIKYLKINPKAFEKCPIFAHFSKATYYRFKLPSLINSDKVLYMDCDILVQKSLSELYNTSLDDNYAIAVEDITVKNKFRLKKNLNVKKYFNAGIMLLNLEKMRKDNIENKCFDFVEKYPEKITWVDQCVLNAVFKEQVKFTNEKYNLIYIRGLKDYKKDAVIVHFAGGDKPWTLGIFHPCKMEYYYYLSKTLYKKRLFLLVLKDINCTLLNFVKKLNLTSKYLVWNLTN